MAVSLIQFIAHRKSYLSIDTQKSFFNKSFFIHFIFVVFFSFICFNIFFFPIENTFFVSLSPNALKSQPTNTHTILKYTNKNCMPFLFLILFPSDKKNQLSHLQSTNIKNKIHTVIQKLDEFTFTYSVCVPSY